MMRWIISLGISLVCFLGVIPLSAVGEVQAATKLCWDANTETDLAGYRVHTGVASGMYTAIKDVVLTATPTNPCEKIVDLGIPEGTGYFGAVTAYDTSGNESGFSNEVTFNADLTPPIAPPNVIIKITIEVIVP